MSEQNESASVESRPPEQLWKINNKKAQKNGNHKGVYWVKKRQADEDGKIRGEKWFHSSRYEGEWNDNAKEGYGIMYYANGDKYEGSWKANKRNGNGTLWKLISKKGDKYKRIYTGEWNDDRMSGQGSYFYENEDRYDGFWLNGKKHGQGRMIYANGDIYEGQWVDDLKDGYGIFTKANGDSYEGYWMKDMKHGQGSFYYGTTSKIYVGEWVEDIPKCGVFTEVEDDDVVKQCRPKYFTDPNAAPPIPELKLEDPHGVLRETLEEVRKLEDKLLEQE